MKAKILNLLKWLGLVLAALALALLVTSLYFYATIPNSIGKPPTLQAELFKKPPVDFPVEGRFIFRSAVELSTMIKQGKASSVEIVQEHINYIKNTNYRTNAFVWLFEEEAIDAARRADEMAANGEPLGLLHGVPISIKEHFWIKGKPSNINSRLFASFVAPRNSALVQTLLNEGAIILGTTNTPELLLDYQTQGAFYPTASNPYDRTRTPGGSSGGGAAAVASGLSPLELGSDMGGSMRTPAAFCGLYALKTTENFLHNYDGFWPDTSGNPRYAHMAISGPLARSVEDVELMWKALKKGAAHNENLLQVDTSKNLNDYSIAWMDEWALGKDRIFVGGDIKAKMATLIDSLSSHGVSTLRDAPDILTDLYQIGFKLIAYMWFENLPWVVRQLVIWDFKRYDNNRVDFSEVYARISDLDDRKYDDILIRKAELIQTVEDFFKEYDFLIIPVASGPAIQKCPKNTIIEFEGERIDYWHYVAFPMSNSVTGHPAITVPLGLNAEGLPIVVQIVGPLHSEERLINFTKLIEHLHQGYTCPHLM